MNFVSCPEDIFKILGDVALVAWDRDVTSAPVPFAWRTSDQGRAHMLVGSGQGYAARIFDQVHSDRETWWNWDGGRWSREQSHETITLARREQLDREYGFSMDYGVPWFDFMRVPSPKIAFRQSWMAACLA